MIIFVDFVADVNNFTVSWSRVRKCEWVLCRIHPLTALRCNHINLAVIKADKIQYQYAVCSGRALGC